MTYREIQEEALYISEQLLQLGVNKGETVGILMEKGWDPDLGARPLRRCIEHYVEDELAERMVKGEFHEGDTLNVDADGDLKVLTFTVVPKAEEAQALPGTDTL